MNRWERYDALEEKGSDLNSLIFEAATYHKDNQSARTQAILWAQVADAARELMYMAEAEFADMPRYGDKNCTLCHGFTSPFDSCGCNGPKEK